jgi:mannobiose 2-epimerase
MGDYRLGQARTDALAATAAELERQLWDGIVPFWIDRAVDRVHGGYVTGYDDHGAADRRCADKYIVTQTRMIWGFAALAKLRPDDGRFRAACEQGIEFFVDRFWDGKHGGWRWRVARDGKPVDDAKLTYGQAFAVYALADAYMAIGSTKALDYASRTFDLLQRNAADNLRGGWLENLEADWKPCADGFDGGDRKSLDIHMHLMEAFTSLYQATGDTIHARRLDETIGVILKHMVNPASGAGGNQYDLDFKPLLPLAINRTWNAERHGETPPAKQDTTSYGHNLELGWLLSRADLALGRPRDHHRDAIEGLVHHALDFGVDWYNGGIFRDGPHHGPATVREKEFWQHAEALPGLLDAFLVTGDERCLDAFNVVWGFATRHMINPDLGEWRVLLSESGEIIDGSLGNPWKAFYHTGRALIESIDRIALIQRDAQVDMNERQA